MRVLSWCPPAQAHHHFVTGGKLFWGLIVSRRGAFLWLGAFVLSGFFDWGTYDPVAFVRGYFAGAFDLELPNP